MSKTLFLGDSHSQGYWNETVMYLNYPHVWQDNNYAEIYANLNNKHSIIYAMSGATIQRYPDWLKVALDKYPNIDEIFVQALHWNRFMLSGSNIKDFTADVPLDYFMQVHSTNALVTRISDIPEDMAVKDGIERDHEYYPSKISGEDYESLKGIPEKWRPNLQKEPYIKVKLWSELMTHLQHREYCRTLFLMDRLCQERGIKMYLWRINDRVYIPDNINVYGDLTSTVKIEKSAETYLKEIGYDISNMLMPDNEHYTLDGHLEIAHKFLPWCKGIKFLDID
jgi:hypothetical protein